MTMPPTLAEPVMLISAVKPLVVTAALLAWGRVVVFFDRDLDRIEGARRLWGGLQVAAGVMGFGLWLAAPGFGIGAAMAGGVVLGTAAGYVVYRNRVAPAGSRWEPWRLPFGSKPAALKAWAGRHVRVSVLDPTSQTLNPPPTHGPYATAHRLLEVILGFALPRRGQSVKVVATAQEAEVAVQIDGVDQPHPLNDPAIAVNFINYIKHCAGLEVDERRKRQTETLQVIAGDYGLTTLGVVCSGSMRGLEMAMDIKPASATTYSLGKLGLMEAQQQQITSALGSGHGMILVSCPPGQGLTTILYTLLGTHDPYTQSIVTLERQIAVEVEGISHHTLAGDPREHAHQLSLLLRQTPDVLMLSDVSGGQAAQVLATSAQDMLIYAGTRQHDTFSALHEWMTLADDPQAAAGALGAIVSGHLVRRLCTRCRTPYTPQPDLLRKLNLDPGRVSQLYQSSRTADSSKRSKPCPDCFGIGYRGCVGVFEVMIPDDRARSLIVQNELDALRHHLRQNKMIWLQEAALAKVIEGVTSISEVSRVLGTRPSDAQATTGGTVRHG